jgi:hypothetical protein
MEKARPHSEATFHMINAETQLMWSSDYPHWISSRRGLRPAVPERNCCRNVLGGTAASGVKRSWPVKKILTCFVRARAAGGGFFMPAVEKRTQSGGISAMPRQPTGTVRPIVTIVAEG